MTTYGFILEKFTTDDFHNFYRLVGDIKVMAMITERALPEGEATAEFEKRLENNTLHPDFGSFKIIDSHSNDFIGLAKIELSHADSEEAELGYMLLPEYWGKGIAGIVAKQLIDMAQKQSFLKNLFAIIDPANIPSRKILINNGFAHKEFKNFEGLPGEILELYFEKTHL